MVSLLILMSCGWARHYREGVVERAKGRLRDISQVTVEEIASSLIESLEATKLFLDEYTNIDEYDEVENILIDVLNKNSLSLDKTAKLGLALSSLFLSEKDHHNLIEISLKVGIYKQFTKDSLEALRELKEEQEGKDIKSEVTAKQRIKNYIEALQNLLAIVDFSDLDSSSNELKSEFSKELAYILVKLKDFSPSIFTRIRNVLEAIIFFDEFKGLASSILLTTSALIGCLEEILDIVANKMEDKYLLQYEDSSSTIDCRSLKERAKNAVVPLKRLKLGLKTQANKILVSYDSFFLRELIKKVDSILCPKNLYTSNMVEIGIINQNTIGTIIERRVFKVNNSKLIYIDDDDKVMFEIVERDGESILFSDPKYVKEAANIIKAQNTKLKDRDEKDR